MEAPSATFFPLCKNKFFLNQYNTLQTDDADMRLQTTVTNIIKFAKQKNTTTYRTCGWYTIQQNRYKSNSIKFAELTTLLVCTPS